MRARVFLCIYNSIRSRVCACVFACLPIEKRVRSFACLLTYEAWHSLLLVESAML